jgi:hypothetical protein
MLAWWIGLIFTVAAITHVAFRLACADCEPSARLLEWIVLATIPIIYITVMVITYRWHKVRRAMRDDLQ